MQAGRRKKFKKVGGGRSKGRYVREVAAAVAVAAAAACKVRISHIVVACERERGKPGALVVGHNAGSDFDPHPRLFLAETRIAL